MSDYIQNLLRQFVGEVVKQLPDQIESFILFGSQARGNSNIDSDIDILVITKEDDWHLSDSVGAIAYEFLLETGQYISLKVISRAHFDYLKQVDAPFIKNILREGVYLEK